MRVLVLALLAGCYEPGVDDCQFTCGPMDDCPDGTSCDNDNFCRPPGASGRCTNIADPCATAPSTPNNCGNRFATPSGSCGVLCTQELQWSDIKNACGAWQAGVLPTMSDRMAANATSDRTWVGASRTSQTAPFVWTNGVQVDSNAFDGGAPSTTSNCAYLDRATDRLRNDRQCEDQNAYICTFP